jgi:hypothetical protein
LSWTGAVYAQLPNGRIFSRISRLSDFEFSLSNNGLLFGDDGNEATGIRSGVFVPYAGYLPRGTVYLYPNFGGAVFKGLMFLGQKGGKLLESDAGFLHAARRTHGPFDNTVPGRVGDPKAGYDTTRHGAGWLYVDDPDYVVYSSMDYDSNGVDISGANYNDWPIRMVNGQARYVAEPLERSRYRPVYRSDEDMFCVFKDTDIRAKREFASASDMEPDVPSTTGPIGVEVQNYAYTWGSGPGKDIVIFRYDVINKSGQRLDSCYVVFSVGVQLTCGLPAVKRKIEVFHRDPWRNLAYVWPTDPSEWASVGWSATPVPPTIGFPLLETPRGYDGKPLGLTRGSSMDTLDVYISSGGQVAGLNTSGNDSIIYRTITQPPPWLPTYYQPSYPYLAGPVLLSGPFGMSPGDTARFSVAYIFADSLPNLLLLDDYITRVYNSGLQRPSAPPASQLSAAGLNRAVKLSWDNRAESATDEIIPDSLGQPFRGYRLLRAVTQGGPFTEIGRWVKDSALVHEYVDNGKDLAGSGGLKNNVQYYYRLLSFDAGAPRLKLDPMESPAIEGVNSISVIPQVEASNVGTQGSDGVRTGGTLGDVSGVRLVPRETTNFVRLLSGKNLQVRIDATTDGTRYLLLVTVQDSLGARTHTALLDPNLMVHGNPSIAGIKEGTLTVGDIFSIGAADVTMHYRFQQLDEPYHIVLTISGTADAPVVVSDSLNVTGILQVTPQTSAARELKVEFSVGGLDTISLISRRYANYLNVAVRDMGTGALLTPGVDYTFKAVGIRRTGSVISYLKQNRYYLSGLLSNGDAWDFGHTLEVYNSMVAIDYADHGVGSGKPSPYFAWGSTHRTGTHDFQPGDGLDLKWQGGVKVDFPESATLTLTGAQGIDEEVTQDMLERIRVVPNPYMVRHEAQRGDRRLYFNYLPEECVIRIYTLSLDLVKTIRHAGGSREEWDLCTEGGTLVASQMLLAHIESPNGKKTVKKFGVIVGR